jgi:hypothetical protein
MEIDKQRVLEKLRREFVADVRDGEALLSKIEHGCWTLTSLRRTDNASQRRPWLLYLEPDEALRARFELAPEVLAVVSPYEKVQARQLDDVSVALASTHRLDRGLVLFFSNDAEARRELSAVLSEERRYLFASIDTLLGASDPQRWFREQLIEQLGSMRPFAPGSPVIDAQFFGRERELDGLERRLLQSANPMGLFGLRKAGKTSLIRRLQSQLLQAGNDGLPRAIVLYLDVQSVSYAQRNRDGLFDRLRTEARERTVDLPGLEDAPWRRETVGRRGASDDDASGVAALEALLRWARANSRKLVLCIDEYELLVNGESIPVDHGIEFLRYLRGVNQQYPTTFSYAIVGRNRSFADRPRIASMQNPLFGAVHVVRLGGLDRDELGTLVRKLGRRASLEFEHRAVDRIFAESGGHPFLARRLADLVDERDERVRTQRLDVAETDITRAMRSFESEVENVMREIADAVEELEPREGLAKLRAAVERDATDDLEPRFVDDLVGYGIMRAPFSARIAVFDRWLRRNVALPRKVGHG